MTVPWDCHSIRIELYDVGQSQGTVPRLCCVGAKGSVSDCPFRDCHYIQIEFYAEAQSPDGAGGAGKSPILARACFPSGA